MPNSLAIFGFSSTSILTNLILFLSLASSSKIGLSILQGPHQVAKKSTNTTNTSDDAKKENDKAEDKNQLADCSSQPTETPDSEKEKKDNAKSRKRALTKELLQEARSFICPIGEYKGKTLGEIMLSNKDCIEYYSKKLDDSDLTYYSKILIFYDQKIKEEKKKKGQGEK